MAKFAETGDKADGLLAKQANDAVKDIRAGKGPVKTPKPKVFINMNKIKSSEDVKTMMQKIADDNASVLNAGGKTHAGIKKSF